MDTQQARMALGCVEDLGWGQVDAGTARQEELRALRDRLEGEIAELTEDLTATSSAAAVGFRRLLTAQGDPLVAAVEEALRLFEFGVQNMDEVFEEKREDLRAVERDGSWTALVEVEGYTRAGKANDFSKFTKHTRLFMSDQGRAPNACWYVNNAYCGQTPAARPGPFHSSQDAVKYFAEYADGLVVPTTELFILVRDVQRGDRTPQEARALLLSAMEQLKHASPSVAAVHRLTKKGEAGGLGIPDRNGPRRFAGDCGRLRGWVAAWLPNRGRRSVRRVELAEQRARLRGRTWTLSVDSCQR